MINKVAVIGAGTMGLAIANLLEAYSNVELLLLDLNVSKVKLNNISRIKLFDITERLDVLHDCDWIIESINEDIDNKTALYNKLAKIISVKTVISSNTSTLMLDHMLSKTNNMLHDRLFITHFFNPPDVLELLEIVLPVNHSPYINKIQYFCSSCLGRYIVQVKDTPGFIANRIGAYFIGITLVEALSFNLLPNEVDLLLSNRLIGFPKTGVFKLLDLIGLDVYMSIMNNITQNIPQSDDLHSIYISLPEYVSFNIQNNYLGKKTGKGFYCKNNDTNFVLNLSNLQYNKQINFHAVNTYNLKNLLEGEHIHSRFLKKIILKTLLYATTLVPKIVTDTIIVDQIMQKGYCWRYGPFEMIDNLGKEDFKGVEYIYKYAIDNSLKYGDIITHKKKLYNRDKYLNFDNTYHKIRNVLNYNDISIIHKRSKYKPIVTNISASLWDVQDGVALFEFRTRNNLLDYYTMVLLDDAISVIQKYFTSMLIFTPSVHFSFGVNLKKFFTQNISYVDKLIRKGQSVLHRMKTSNFPVLGIGRGYVVGGGLEILLHCDKVIMLKGAKVGFVESNIGLIPAWGGCKEILLRHDGIDNDIMFNNIMEAKIYTSSDIMIANNFMKQTDMYVNHNQSLDFAIHLVKNMIANYKIYNTRNIICNKFYYDDKLFEGYDKVIADKLFDMLIRSNGKNELDILDMERKLFLDLLSDERTKSRVKHMFFNKKKLKN